MTLPSQTHDEMSGTIRTFVGVPVIPTPPLADFHRRLQELRREIRAVDLR